MILTKEQKQTVIDGVKKCIDRANEYYKPVVPFRMPIVRFDLRGTTAANANTNGWVVNFNVVLLIENWKDMIENTIPHEVAHLIDLGHLQKNNGPRRIVWTRRGPRREKRSVHGDSWKSVMRVFGVPEAEILRCHDYDVTNARVKNKVRYQYNCSCRSKVHNLGPKAHKIIQMGNFRGYHMRCCKVRFTAADWVQTPAAPPVVRKPFIAQATGEAPAPVPVPPAPPKVVRPGTKLDYAIQVLGTHQNLSRQQFISMMIRDQNMSFAGAQTYYYSALKALKSECKAA